MPTPRIVKVEKQPEFRFEEEIHVTYCMGNYWPLLSRIRDLFRRETLHPIVIVTLYFLTFHASGMSGVRPYMVHVIEEFQMPFDTHWAAVSSEIFIFILNVNIYFIIIHPMDAIKIFKKTINLFLFQTRFLQPFLVWQQF